MMREIDNIFDEHIVKAIDMQVEFGIALAYERGFEELEENLIAMRAEFHKQYGHLLK